MSKREDNAAADIWWAAGTALLLNALIGAGLYHAAWSPIKAPESPAALQVVYWVDARMPDGHVAVPKASVQVVPKTASPRESVAASEVPHQLPKREASTATVDLMGTDSHSPEAGERVPMLDLTLRESISFASPGLKEDVPWERPEEKGAEPTRFDQSWAPTEKSIQHDLAYRSRIAGHLLGAVGALREPCTRRERQRMEEKCHGAQYRGDFESRVEELSRR
ncbi:hypothetical protein [Luteimonas sp. 100069]|uniref:hypothetical protein n=1 Tax=Luteimonas sp. 100069 TaxID=2006109 RepID=UPI000F4E3431|nr:hypothetical protein [Luteimonas sp. 100069]